MRACRARHCEGRPRRPRNAQLPGGHSRLHGHSEGRRRCNLAQRLVGAGRDGACDPAHRSQPDHCRRAPCQAHRRALRGQRRRRHRPHAAHRGIAAPFGRRKRRRASRDRARGRCDDPLHLRLDRPVQGRAVDASRGRHRHLHLRDRPDRPARAPDAGRPRTRHAAADLAQRPAVPRHRRSPGDAQQLRHRPLHGDHAQVGRDGGAAPHREGEDHLFRGRADDEPGAHDAPRPRRI